MSTVRVSAAAETVEVAVAVEKFALNLRFINQIYLLQTLKVIENKHTKLWNASHSPLRLP